MLYSCAPSSERSVVTRAAEKIRRGGNSLKILSVLFCGLALGGGTPAARAQVPSSDFFPIGVHSQPKNSFDLWKSRGINTLFQYEAENNSLGNATVSMSLWSSTAASKGLYYVRAPSANPADDLQEKNLIAWAQKDEPDLSNHSPNPAVNIDIYQNWKATGPSKPVWINFAGPGVTPVGADYTQWVKGGDWIAVDWYPINWNRENNINFIGLALDKLRQQANGVPKKYFAYIETSWQKLAGSSAANTPTPDQFRGEVWSAIMHGANGIIYFPQVVPDRTIGGSFSYDGTPADVAAEMTRVDATVQSYGRVLNAARNPSSRSMTSANAAIETTWRVMQEGDYFFVLNQSANTLTGVPLNLTGLPLSVASLAVLGENRTELLAGGAIVDDFTPYQVHIYQASAVPGTGLPEPVGAGVLVAMAGSGMLKRRNRPRGHDGTR
jgi:hypothetical protein